MAAEITPGYPVIKQSPPDVLKQGKLMKKGAGVFGSMSWKDRYFILKSNGVFEYYEDSQYTQMKGSIEVDKIYKTQRKDSKNLFLITKDRTWHLYTENASELDEWQRVLTQLTKREDAITFTIQSADFAAIIGTGLQNSNMFGFVGDGLTVQLVGSANVINKVTFSSFNYPAVVHDIKVGGNNVINLNNYLTVIQLSGSHSYHIDLEKKSLSDDCSVAHALNTRNVEYPIIKHDFEEQLQPEGKQSFNDNDIFVNMNLQCNYKLCAQQCVDLIGEASTGFFKSDSRKLQVNVSIGGTASIRPTYTILQKNNPTAFALWQEYCNQLLNKQLEQRIQQIRRKKGQLIQNGNRFHLLPNHVQSKFPLQQYYVTPISQQLLNKKCLCHVEDILVNKYGETLSDTVYVMAAIHFVREEMFDYAPQLCDTIHVDVKNHIMHRKHKTLIGELFEDKSIPFGRGIRHTSSSNKYDTRISHLGRRLIDNAHHTNGPVSVELSYPTSSQQNVGVHYCVRVYAKKSEKRFNYNVETTVSRTDQSDPIDDMKMNTSSSAFSAPYVFDKPRTVVIQHRGGGDGHCFTSFLRVGPQAVRRADANGGKGQFAQWQALPRDGGHKIQFKSMQSGHYLRIHNNTVDVNGTGGKFTVFWVHRESDGSVQLESELECGRYVAIGKHMAVRTGNGGPWCNLRLFTNHDDCIIL
eukprot:258494_1